MNYYEIGQRIRKFRKASSLSQEELAEKVGISVTHMSHIETGNTKLSLEVFVNIATVLDIQTDELLRNEFSGKKLAEDELFELLNKCNEKEIKFILDMIKSAKISMDKYLK